MKRTAREKRTRMKATEPRHSRSFDVRRHVLSNGLIVLLVDNPSIPAVSLSVSVLTGARHEPEAKAGLAMMVSRLLDEGTKTRTSLEIAEAIESVGGMLDSDGSYERIVVSALVLKEDIDLGLELAADILINPIFPEAFIEKEKSRTLSEIASARDRPQVIAGWEFCELIYGKHPLHRPSHGYPETVSTLTRADLLDYHENFIVPNNAILSMVGDFRTSEVLSRIERYFGTWRSKPLSLPSHSKPLRQTDRRIKYISMPAQQLNIYLGHLGIERSTPDYYALQVLDTILGGGAGFTARIPQRLRDELGLAYTTFASITASAGADPGRFVSYIGTSPENMKAAIEGLVHEIQRIINEPVTDQELQDARDYLTGSFVFSFETSSQIARFLVHAEVYGLGFDYIDKYPEYIRAITTSDISRVARQYLDSENYTMVVVGPIDENGKIAD